MTIEELRLFVQKNIYIDALSSAKSINELKHILLTAVKDGKSDMLIDIMKKRFPFHYEVMSKYITLV